MTRAVSTPPRAARLLGLWTSAACCTHAPGERPAHVGFAGVTARLLSALLTVCLLQAATPAAAQAPEAPPAGEPAVARAPEAPPAEPPSLEQRIDTAFGELVVAPIATVLFADLAFWSDEIQLPFIVAWLVFGALFFTLRMQFINLRGFRHAIEVTRGRYDHPDDPGEVSHFQALASALSATVGLGNIAGVAIAVSTGGPGAIFWMMAAGFLGMSSKFVECTLGQMYREVDTRGHVLGGPMRYLSVGLAERGMPGLGKVLAAVFAAMCIGGSMGGGNMFQSNQSYAQVSLVLPFFADMAWLYGLLMAALVGIVIIGGIKRIGSVAGYIVPVMCAVYVLAGIFILVTNAAHIPQAFGQIIGEAFTPKAQFGGLLGVLVTGFRRAAFSNEAGVGSASIAHSAAATDEPVREGVVALLEPFIDTIVICTMTGLVVVITGAYESGQTDGVEMTSAAFAGTIAWFPNVLALAVFFFAFSTMISWSYYGERCWTFLFGAKSSMSYRLIFLVFTALGPILQLNNVLTFSDLMILGMALPNMAGAILLAPKVKANLDDYWSRYTSGAMPPRR